MNLLITGSYGMVGRSLIKKIDKRKIVLGVSDSSINFLTELDYSNEPEKPKSKPRQFKDVLNKLDPNQNEKITIHNIRHNIMFIYR